jgi:hypothetical protein
MAATALSWLTEQCEYYARHYGYKDDDREHGLENFAAHLFVQEEGFNELPPIRGKR